ncbi:GNAT family N-acetyltransferase [Actinomyces ruminis]|uniref:GNAT family N-acetyltransferase n=1 Tax=Actinomyces ruminis TaxID=1937003 RepID=UPI00211E18A4|nr:GNAT family N-acetyltransferase [Actinomyces ruminis]
MATVPAVRRRGVATALLGALLRVAADAGCRAVLLEVRASNEGAQRLYEAHGFKAIGHRRRYYLAPVEDAVVMRRPL